VPKRAHFRFYEELNDFLPRAQRYKTIERAFDVTPSVKDMIEALGVPHPEIDLILVNGESVDFSYRLADGDLVSVYPMFESLDISPVVRLRPEPLRATRFAVDVNLGRLARYLRLLGFDTAYDPESPDETLAETSQEDGRVLLTRDVGLLKRGAITHGYFVRAVDPVGQAIEVLRRFHLAGSARPFTRCTLCNTGLVSADKKDIAAKVPPASLERFDEFRICPGCGQVYWEGSHMPRARGLVDEMLTAAELRSESSRPKH
jgi:uncharacterized protein with PIN domain